MDLGIDLTVYLLVGIMQVRVLNGKRIRVIFLLPGEPWNK